MDYDALLDLGTELGYKLVLSGAEIYRVEESVLRLLTAYGLQPQVFALPSCLIVSVNTPSGHPITQMRRVPPHGTDIELLERCNELCRRLCREVPPLPEAGGAGEKAGAGPQGLPDPDPAAGLCGRRGFFTAFYGGTLLDTLCGGLCGLAVGLWMLWASPRLRFNNLFQTLIGAAIASLLALILVHMGIGRPAGGYHHRDLDGAGAGDGPDQRHAGDHGGRYFLGPEPNGGVDLDCHRHRTGRDGLAGHRKLGRRYGTFGDLLMPSLWAFLACVGFGAGI